MELRRVLVPAATTLLPLSIRQRFYDEAWLKSNIDVAVREHEEALNIRSQPLPHLEIQFKLNNRLPVPVQVYGASVEIWLGKPVVQFYSYLSESFRAGESKESLHAYTFLNNYQLDLLNPPKKTSLPPNVSVNLTVSCRTIFGTFEKSVKSTWIPPKILP